MFKYDKQAVKDIKNLKSAKLDSKAKQLIEIITELSPDEWEPPFLRDLINPGNIVLMITPIDSRAPKGRMIMPQVRAWRDILDGGGIALSCEPANLQKTLDSLKNKPALVVTDSQVFSKVAPIVPEDVPFTSFSILSIRQKGKLSSRCFPACSETFRD